MCVRVCVCVCVCVLRVCMSEWVGRCMSLELKITIMWEHPE